MLLLRFFKLNHIRGKVKFMQNVYDNKDKKCECCKCELKDNCNYKYKYQRLPRTVSGALGLCKKL